MFFNKKNNIFVKVVLVVIILTFVFTTFAPVANI